MKDIVMQVFNGEFLNSETKNIIKYCQINRAKHAFGTHNMFKFFEPKFTLTDKNRQVLGILLDYFTGNPESQLDLKKGIFLLGGVGTGKSLIFKVFKEYTKTVLRCNSYLNFSSKQIIDNVNVNGIEYLSSINFVNNNPTTIYIDDIASGNEIVTNYGTKINVIESLLGLRYDIFSKYKKLTHLSSNIYPKELKEIYGSRITDRLKEMCNIVELSGDSFRK